jgi:membrane-bound ClpP family serine protease
MKERIKDWLKVLVLLLDEAVVVAVVLVALWFFGVDIPLWLSVTLGVVLGAVVIVIHKLVIPSFHRRQATGRESMVGLQGEVVEPLTPEGTVKVKGEFWKARSIEGNITYGEHVKIRSVNHLMVEVRRQQR